MAKQRREHTIRVPMTSDERAELERLSLLDDVSYAQVMRRGLAMYSKQHPTSITLTTPAANIDRR